MGAYFRVGALWIPLESPSKMRPDGTTFMLFDPVLTELQRKQIWSQQLVRSDRKSTRLNSSHSGESRMPSSA